MNVNVNVNANANVNLFDYLKKAGQDGVKEITGVRGWIDRYRWIVLGYFMTSRGTKKKIRGKGKGKVKGKVKGKTPPPRPPLFLIYVRRY